METLHWLDILMIAIYFIVLLSIGFWIMRSKKEYGESESFLAADRNMGLVRTTGSVSATDLGGGFSIAMGGLGFSVGISGQWMIAAAAISAILASFFMVPKIKRWADSTKGLSTGDLFEQRFDRKTGLLAALLIGVSWFAFVGGQVIAGAKLLEGTIGLDLTVAIFLAGSVILAYTIMGGLKAVIYTDVFQVVILLFGIIFLMVPIGLHHVGGWDALMAKLNASPETEPLTDWMNAGWKKIIGWFMAVFPLWFIAITSLQRVIAAKDEKTARRALFITGFPIEWPLFAIGATLIGLFARILVPELEDAELAIPVMIIHLLPVGITGVVIAAYIAAVMSTADSCLMGPVTIFVNDVYKKHINPHVTGKQMVTISRWMTLILGILAIVLAWQIPSVIDLILYAYTFGAAGIFFPMLGLLFWKRTTSTGAFSAIIAGGSAAIIWTILGEPWDFASSYAGWAFSFVTLVVVSLLTKHKPTEDIESFYKKKERNKIKN